MNVLQSDVEHFLRHDDLALIKEKFAGISSDVNISNIILMDHAGKVVEASSGILVGEQINDVLPVISEQSQKNFEETTATVESTRVGNVSLSQDGQTINAIYPVLFPGPGISLVESRTGTVLVQYDLSLRKNAAQSRVLLQTGLFGIFAVVSALLVVLSLHLLFGNRITRLMTVMQAFAVDNVHIPSNIKGTDEVGQLAAQFDVMAEEIERDTAEVKKQQSEILRLNSNLVEAVKTKDEFIQDMNHELRTPLTAIIGYTEMILGGVDSDAEPGLAASVTTVQRNALRLQLLVDNLMHASSTVSGGTPLVITPVNIGLLLDDAVGSMKLNAEQSGVEMTLRLDSPASDLLLDGDADQLQRVFFNLAHNAIKYTPREGKVTIVARRAHTDGDYVEVTVTDTGIGIPREDFPRVFDRFFRASTVIETSIPGFGLGLSLVHSIVGAHHGTITFDSTAGKGTVFTVRLPVKFIPTGPPDETT